MEQSMSITQALAELKLLDKRLRTHLTHMRWVDVSTEDNRVDKDKLKAQAQAEFQSYMDLVKRRDSLKRAIVLSNANTRVKIGTWEGTVAEAIEHKSALFNKRNLADIMKEHLQEKRTQFEAAQNQLNGRLERLLQSELGKDVKTNPDTLAALTTTFRSSNKVEFVDPLDLAAKIGELEEEVSSFETNVDWVLSESNGKTLIKVPSCSSQVVVPSFTSTTSRPSY
jgi:hypothetical protein